MKVNFKEIDIETWNRKEAYQCFLKFQTPQVGVDFDLEVGDSFSLCKEHNISFFDFILYHSLNACNEIENFRYRIRDGKPIIHEVVHPDWVVMNDDHSISTRCSEYHQDFKVFSDNRKNRSTILSFGEDECLDHLVFVSCTPWLDFVSVSQAIFSPEDCIPKLVWGKCKGDKLRYSIQAHHSLVDAYHIALFKNHVEKCILEFPWQSLC